MALHQIADDKSSDNVDYCPGVFTDTEAESDVVVRGWRLAPATEAQIEVNDREHAVRIPRQTLLDAARALGEA